VPENPYDQIRYTTYPRQDMHPDRLSAVGRLFGMNPAPAPVDRCRVLEIGCGDGTHLIGMAYHLPESRFVGVDLAPERIRAAERTAECLGLTNVTFEARSLADIDAAAGEFDFVLAHGLYSWIPAELREALVRVCGERLAPNGIAFISYNASPGCYLRQMMRDMMLYHTRQAQGADEKITQARWLVEWLRDSHLVAAPLGETLAKEAAYLLEKPADALYHDDLGEWNDPVYFRYFISHAAAHGLQFLGEAEISEMFDPLGRLKPIQGGVLECEQYHDFVTLRRFRRTLLCRQDVTLARSLTSARMHEFLFSAPPMEPEEDRVTSKSGARIAVKHEAVIAVLKALGERHPLPVAFDDLLPFAGNERDLADILFGLLIGGFATPHVHRFPCQTTVRPKPRASRLARSALDAPFVTTACHAPAKLDEKGRRLLGLMDGTREVSELAAETGESVEDVERYALWCAGMGLLEA
jgi:SAM-dependent methyltransferase